MVIAWPVFASAHADRKGEGDSPGPGLGPPRPPPAGFPWLMVAGKLLSGWVVIDLDAP